MRHRLGSWNTTDVHYWRTAVRALQHGFIRNSSRKRLEHAHVRLTDCICAYWVRQVPKPAPSSPSKMNLQAVDRVPQGAAELRKEAIDANEKQKGAEAKEDYATELESLFGVEKGHM